MTRVALQSIMGLVGYKYTGLSDMGLKCGDEKRQKNNADSMDLPEIQKGIETK